MKEVIFILDLLALVLLGFYSMDRVDCFLQENYRRQWEEPEQEAAPIHHPRRHTIRLPALFHCGTIFCIRHNRW